MTNKFTNGFKIIGISTRTTNKNNQSQEDLGKLWMRFFSDNVIEKIPNKSSFEIISLYTDYKSDFTEEYTTLIGLPVSTLDEIPAGMVGREFQAEHFQTLTAQREMPKAVVDTWATIWARDNELNRKYTYDFEVYGEKSQQGTASEVDIYLSIKS
jgi:predicted transcriptional regulator YdeE